MSFQCPQCLASSSLEINWSLSLQPDCRSDEICLQVIACTQCGFSGLAVYEESQRGPLDTQHWDHTGYRAALSLVQAVEQAVRECKDPMNPDCACAAHRLYNLRDAHLRWVNPAEQAGAPSFPMIHFSAERDESVT
jgi:hypothetical protein